MGRTVDGGENGGRVPYRKYHRPGKAQHRENAGRFMGMVERVVSVKMAGKTFIGIAIRVAVAMVVGVVFRASDEHVVAGFLGHRLRDDVGRRVSDSERQHAGETGHQDTGASIQEPFLPQ